MKYTIIGAGPAGLTAGLLLAEKPAYRQAGIKITIFEQEKQVGGLAKTVRYKGNRFDIGGHRFFAKYPAVDRFWSKILGKNLIWVDRRSQIFYRKHFFHYPIEPFDAFKNLGLIQAVPAAWSYFLVKIKPCKPEKNLEDVYINSFGRFLYRKFFRTYSTRLWGIPPTKMEPDWGRARVGKLSFLNALKDAFFPKSGNIKSLIKKFRYPKLGPGQMWEAVAQKIKKKGGLIYLNSPVTRIFHRGTKIVAIRVKGKKITVDQLLSTMPMKDLINCFWPKTPNSVLEAADSLKYRDFILVALIIKKKNIFPGQWIYIQDPGFKCLRVQNINNWSQALVADKNQTVLGVEYTAVESDPIWPKKDLELIDLAKKEVVRLGFAMPGDFIDAKVVREPKVYPVYDLGYRRQVEIIKNYLARFSNLTLIGRNGTHKYNNMDHSILMAMKAVENFFGAKNDLWQINTQDEYLEKE